MGYYEGEINGIGGGSGDSWGSSGGGWWGGIIALIAVAAIFGRNGGIFGNNNQGAVTQADLCTSLNFNNLNSSVRSIGDSVNVGFANLNSTICNQQYDTARMIDGLNTSMLQGFNTTNVTALQGFNGVQSQLASCCCDLSRQIERVACGEAQNTAAIISAGQQNTQRILDYLCNEKISSLQSENALLTAQLSQNAQTRTIIDSLKPVAPVPSYTVPNPFTGTYGYSYGCGCNSGCGCSGSVL